MTTFFDRALAEHAARQAEPQPRWRKVLDAQVQLNRITGVKPGRHKAGAS